MAILAHDFYLFSSVAIYGKDIKHAFGNHAH